jgi:hypothetical protein
MVPTRYARRTRCAFGNYVRRYWWCRPPRIGVEVIRPVHSMERGEATFILPKLPYRENALEPIISARTISFHYGKHHAGYVDTLNKLVEGTSFAGRPLEEIVLQTAKDPKTAAIFHNAAQTWNHNSYWLSMGVRGRRRTDRQAQARNRE